jgi:hypothetical protein
MRDLKGPTCSSTTCHQSSRTRTSTRPFSPSGPSSQPRSFSTSRPTSPSASVRGVNGLVHRVGIVQAFSPVVGIGTHQPLTRRRVCPPPPFWFRGRGTLARGKVVWESQYRRGDIHCGTLYIFVLCGLFS